MVLRGCLENALYGFFFHKHPKKVEIWMKRQDSVESRKKVKDTFKIQGLLDTLQTDHPSTGKITRHLYERTIDYGAHPNELALTSNLRRQVEGKTIEFNLSVLAGHNLPTQMCLKTTAQVGVCAFMIFKEIFKERFEISGLSEEISKLSRGL